MPLVVIKLAVGESHSVRVDETDVTIRHGMLGNDHLRKAVEVLRFWVVLLLALW